MHLPIHLQLCLDHNVYWSMLVRSGSSVLNVTSQPHFRDENLDAYLGEEVSDKEFDLDPLFVVCKWPVLYVSAMKLWVCVSNVFFIFYFCNGLQCKLTCSAKMTFWHDLLPLQHCARMKMFQSQLYQFCSTQGNAGFMWEE